MAPDDAAAAKDAAEIVRKWDARLDRMDYFQMLRVERPTDAAAWPADDVLKRAFAAFASSFHPDRYAACEQDVRAMAMRIFRRGNEALRVLLNPGLRARYLRHLASGKLRLEGEEMTRAPSLRPVGSRDAESASSIPLPPSSSRLGAASGHLETAGAAPESQRSAAAAASIESIVTSQAALPFAREADVLLAKGDRKKALFQLQIAISKEPDNQRLLARIVELTPPKKP